MKLRYFQLKEFSSPDDKESCKKMNPRFLKFIDELRHRCGFGFYVTSGFRTKNYHKSLTRRGYHTIPTSAHLKGLAADIRIMDSTKRALFIGHALELCHELDLPFRVGVAGKEKGNFCHIDIDESKSNPRMWIY
tara:strand:+ start:110 stop:511 length:402 start_codon:yes stop_codon:yes gene_type:complete